MAIGTFYPAVSGDDGIWDGVNEIFDATGDYLLLGCFSEGYDHKSFVRFPNVNIPVGATITSAKLTFQAYNARTEPTCNLNCYFNDADNAVAPTSISQANALALTSAVAWNGVGSWTINTDYDSPDLTTILQAIVDRAGWASGNAVMAVIKNNSSSSGARRYPKSYNLSPTLCARLVVTWTEPQIYNKTIEETLNIIDELADYYDSAEDTIDLADSSAFQFVKEIYDTIDLTEIFPFYYEDVADGFAIADESASSWLKTVAETLFIYDEVQPGWALTAADGLDLADTLAPILGISISDWLWLVDSQGNNWDGVEVIEQLLNLYDTSEGRRVFSHSIAETLDIADATVIQWLKSVLEHMQFTDLVTAIGTFNHSAAEALGLTDEASKAFHSLIAEALSLVDASTILVAFMPSLAESLGLADESTNGLTVSKVITDLISMTDTSVSGLAAYCMVQDAIALNVIIEIDDEAYECYVLNTPQFFPSVYSGFDFNSYCVFEGKAYGANATGIYELTGETDAGAAINTGVILSQTTFGIPNKKKMRRAWFGITGTAPTLVLEVEDGTRKAYTVDSYGEVGSDREVKGKTWKLSVAGFDELDFIKILPVALAR